MPASLPSIRIPFSTIADLPPTAQYQIRRDFEEIVRQISPAGSIFDAIIDSELSASNSANHLYKNLTDLVANETWDVNKRFNVGVKQGQTAITEPAGVSLGGKKIALFGIGSDDFDPSVAWQWKGVGGAGMQLVLQGLNINGAVASTAIANTGNVTALNCHFGSNITNLNHNGIVGQSGQAWNCTFDGAMTASGSIGVGLVATFFDCHFKGGLTVTSQLSLKVYGGDCAGITIATTSTNSQTIISDLSNGGVTISSGGSVYVQNTATAGGPVAVNGLNANGTCMIIGAYSGVSFNIAVPATSASKQSFYGSCDSLLVNGGVSAHCSIGTAFVSGRLQVQGGWNQIVVQFNKFTVPACKFVGATHSQVHAAMSDVGAGSQAYTFDAASNHNLLIISGMNAANFTTPSTDAGSHNRVITEDFDSYVVSPPATGQAPNMLPSELMAIQSGVERFPIQDLDPVQEWRKDMLPGVLFP